jgi:hypothetical protein
MTTDTARTAERIAATRHRDLVAAVRCSAPGMDTGTAIAILAAAEPVLREQIAQDMAGLCARHGLPCAGDGCHHEFAALLARGIR